MKQALLIAAVLFVLYSCDSGDRYLVDGGISSGKVDLNTMDFFKSHSQLDTLAILIEKAGLTSVVNGETTIFAPNNNSIKNYVNKVLTEMRKVDPQAEFTVNDIPTDTLTKYMGSYIFSGKIKRNNMTKEGKIYTAQNGEQRRISLEPTEEYTGQLETYPEYVYFTYKVGAEWDAWNDANGDDDKFVIRTSDIESTNGIIHVIQGNYTLFNYDPN